MRNGTIMQYFEWNLPQGMLWKKLHEDAPDLAEAGITAVWIPPAYKGAQGQSDVGYGTYDIWDLGEFDQKGSVPTKYGTKQELIDAVSAAHASGLDVYADIVLDHMMGADIAEEVSAAEMQPGDRCTHAEENSRVISAWTGFTFPGRAGKYSGFQWHWEHFDGVDWDEKENRSAIYLFDTKQWSEQVDSENGNFDYLMGADIDLSHPDVVDELTRWGRWFVNETNVDGFRFDAVKHMKAGFYRKWIADLRQSTKDELFSVGEYWNGDLDTLLNYVDQTDSSFSLFDVPLHYQLQKAATSDGSFDMRKIFDGSLVQARPQLAVTFVDNHDTQPGQSLESFVPDWFKPHAYALVLLREAGYPCIFYGDYYGLAGVDLEPKKSMLDKLLRTRTEAAYGTQHDYFDDESVIGWTREGDEEHPQAGTAVLLTNAGGGRKKMYIGKQHAGRTMQPVLGSPDSTVLVAEDGTGEFTVPDGGVAVWTF